MPSDPHWPRASAWLAGEHDELAVGRLAVLGVPMNRSITPGRCDLAPAAIREALARYSPFDIEQEIDLQRLVLTDLGDLPILDLTNEQALAPVSQAVLEAVQANDAVVLLGGDNGVTRPGVHGLGIPLNQCGLITLDAHFDLRDTAGGLMNGNPIRALLADGLPGKNIAQIGIQSFANSRAYAEVAHVSGIRVYSVGEIHITGLAAVMADAFLRIEDEVDAIYIDCDFDILDRAFAPATPGSRPGGVMPWQLRQAVRLCGSHPKVKALDLVEIDPTKDINDITSLAAAACLLAFAAGLTERLVHL